MEDITGDRLGAAAGYLLDPRNRRCVRRRRRKNLIVGRRPVGHTRQKDSHVVGIRVLGCAHTCDVVIVHSWS